MGEIDTDTSTTEMQVLLREARMTSIRNMWLVISGCFAAVLVDLVYSLWLFFTADSECHIEYLSQGVYDGIQYFDTLMMYFFWVYPLLYVFWPSVRTSK